MKVIFIILSYQEMGKKANTKFYFYVQKTGYRRGRIIVCGGISLGDEDNFHEVNCHEDNCWDRFTRHSLSEC